MNPHQEIDGKNSQKEDAWGLPHRWDGPTSIPFLIAFTIDFLRFKVHFSRSVWVLRKESISGHVGYGPQTDLY